MRTRGKTVIVALLLSVVFFVFGFFFSKADKVETIYDGIRVTMLNNYKRSGISSCTVSVETDEYWNSFCGVLAHAGGVINSNSYTNSREAIENSISNGVNYIEVDVHCTSDGILVLDHTWSDFDSVPTYAEFISNLIYELYTPMDLNDILNYIEQDEVSFVLDIRVDDSELNVLAEWLQSESVLKYSDFIAVMFSSKEALVTITQDSVCDEYCYIYRPKINEKYVDVAEFCSQHSVSSICYNPSHLCSTEDTNIFKSLGFTILLYTVDEAYQAYGYLKSGADGVFSNYITPSDILYY